MQPDNTHSDTAIYVRTLQENKMSSDAPYLNILKTSNTFSQFAKRACTREVVQHSKMALRIYL